jgi:hypothetical protein
MTRDARINEISDGIELAAADNIPSGDITDGFDVEQKLQQLQVPVIMVSRKG